MGGDLRVVIANQGDTDGAVFHGSSLRLLIDGVHYRLAFTHSIWAFPQVINAVTHYQLDYPDLALILALVRGGSLARASQLLKVDVSTVFRAVRRLEAALGQQLFEKAAPATCRRTSRRRWPSKLNAPNRHWKPHVSAWSRAAKWSAARCA